MNTEDYSEEVKDILIHKPIWIVRWGMAMVLLIFILLALGSYFFKFPIIVSTQAELVKIPTEHYNPKSVSIKAFISPLTIESIKVDLPVTLDIPSLPYKQFGKLIGNVVSILGLNNEQEYEIEIELIDEDAIRIYSSNEIDYSVSVPCKANILIGNIRLIEQVIPKKF